MIKHNCSFFSSGLVQNNPRQIYKIHCHSRTHPQFYDIVTPPQNTPADAQFLSSLPLKAIPMSPAYLLYQSSIAHTNTTSFMQPVIIANRLVLTVHKAIKGRLDGAITEHLWLNNINSYMAGPPLPSREVAITPS